VSCHIRMLCEDRRFVRISCGYATRGYVTRGYVTIARCTSAPIVGLGDERLCDETWGCDERLCDEGICDERDCDERVCHETWDAGVDINTVDTLSSLFQFPTHFWVRFVPNKSPLPLAQSMVLNAM